MGSVVVVVEVVVVVAAADCVAVGPYQSSGATGRFVSRRMHKYTCRLDEAVCWSCKL